MPPEQQSKKASIRVSILITEDEERQIDSLCRRATCAREQGVSRTAVLRAALRTLIDLPTEQQIEAVSTVCDEKRRSKSSSR